MKLSCLSVSLFSDIINGKMSIKEYAQLCKNLELDGFDLGIIAIKQVAIAISIIMALFIGLGNIVQAVGEPNAQQASTIQGKVIDSKGEVIIGGTIQLKGKKVGVISDSFGKFSINVNDDPKGTLVFSFIGYETQEIQLTGQTILNVTMEMTLVSLDQVVVIGYGTVKKTDITGSVSRIDSKGLTAVPTQNTSQALKGLASGVEVKQNSGNPLARVEVRIRGANSMFGSNDPLYVVDGVPLIGGIEYLSSSDIETMDVLKDASATAIYGARGANGVIIITTKRGLKGQKGKISIDSYYGVQNEVKRYDVLDAKQYATIVNEWLKNDGKQPYFDNTICL